MTARRLLSLWGFTFTPRTLPSPVGVPAPAVETVRAGVGAVGRAAPAHPLLQPGNQWGDPNHDGSADLEWFAPSAAELEVARAVLADEADIRDLGDLCQSFARTQAVLKRARVEQTAGNVLGRIA